MSQHRSLTGFFGDDSFFSPERLLWPLNYEALNSLQQDFFNRRSKLADSLLRELHDGPQLLQLSPLPLISSTLARMGENKEQRVVEAPATELHKEVQPATSSNSGDLLVTLDARGYAPGDITVKLEGRKLAVVAMKQAGAEESQSCSSSSSSAAFRSSASSQTGFVQKIELPAHLDLSGLSCSLMDGGQLRIHAPVAKQSVEKEKEEEEEEEEEEGQVPIRFKTSLEFPIKKDKTEEEDTH